MRYLGHPLFNDERYGGDKILKGTAFQSTNSSSRIALRPVQGIAPTPKKLGFVHPATGELMEFETVIPAEVAEVIRKFESYTTTSNWEKERRIRFG